MNNEYEFTGIGSAGDGSGADPDHLGSIPVESNLGPDYDTLDPNQIVASEADNMVRDECRDCASHQGGTSFDNDLDELKSRAPGQTEAEDLTRCPYYDEIPGSYTAHEDMPRQWNESDNTGDRQDDDGYPRMSY
jgi:hypothetical protein